MLRRYRGAELREGEICRPKEADEGSKMFSGSGLSTGLSIEAFFYEVEKPSLPFLLPLENSLPFMMGVAL